MRKQNAVALLLFLLLAGCGEQDPGTVAGNGTGEADVEQVVNTHGTVENAGRLDEFVSSVEQRKNDAVQVVNFTTEGDPIYQTLEFDGEVIKFTHDSSRDQFSSGSITTMNCGSISKKETASTVDYVLTGCEQGEAFNVLAIEK